MAEFQPVEIASLPPTSHQVNYQSAQLSPDGTSPETESPNSSPSLKVLSTLKSPESINSFTFVPYFDLNTESTTLVLSSCKERPIQLSNVLSFDSGHVAQYKLTSPTTEAFLQIHSLLITRDATRFLAASRFSLHVFEAHKVSEGPVQTIPLCKARKQRRFERMSEFGSLLGVISCMAICPTDGLLAVGTFARGVGLYADEGLGDAMGVFQVYDETFEAPGGETLEYSGKGIHQLIWSPCGRFLYVVERESDGVAVYDIRGTGTRVGWLHGRNATSSQRMSVNVSPTAEGHEVWGGGVDGRVRVWKIAGKVEGPVQPSMEWQAHEDPVTSVLIHPSGRSVVTCSAEDWRAKLDAESSEESSEASSDASSDSESSTESESSGSDVSMEASSDAEPLSGPESRLLSISPSRHLAVPTQENVSAVHSPSPSEDERNKPHLGRKLKIWSLAGYSWVMRDRQGIELE
ncbi:hypothetical protein K402DRAFT_458195 [Aulographum hederae CBS 113979]|uniref:WD40 repeat-like protein n=1 Tax=Aulographum hederae CBS 113979 TaxID=1176131 RepID=A0A6G1GK53_9PEZI|nr:hypothetical protein K402DRAFT_458195 [Aulographum hederae CBS 113979]